MEKRHERAYSRMMNRRKALRLRRIDRMRNKIGNFPDTYDNLHQYSKNKIHCSCPVCRGKTWSLGDNSDAQRCMSDQKKILGMRQQMNELDNEENF